MFHNKSSKLNLLETLLFICFNLWFFFSFFGCLALFFFQCIFFSVVSVRIAAFLFLLPAVLTALGLAFWIRSNGFWCKCFWHSRNKYRIFFDTTISVMLTDRGCSACFKLTGSYCSRSTCVGSGSSVSNDDAKSASVKMFALNG